MRAVAVDDAGNTPQLRHDARRAIVDNTGPAVAVTAPGMFRGTTTVNATATDPRGVAAAGVDDPVEPRRRQQLDHDLHGRQLALLLQLEREPRSPTAPTTCARSRRTPSATRRRRPSCSAYVNNTGPTGTDVQGTNGGVNDRLDAGDTVIFTYSEAIAPASILAGWNGSSTAIRVRVNNNGATDAMTFYDAANTTALEPAGDGHLAVDRGRLRHGPDGVQRHDRALGLDFTVTIGTLISGALATKAKGKSTMTWQTSSPATSLTTGIARARRRR